MVLRTHGCARLRELTVVSMVFVRPFSLDRRWQIRLLPGTSGPLGRLHHRDIASDLAHVGPGHAPAREGCRSSHVGETSVGVTCARGNKLISPAPSSYRITGSTPKDEINDIHRRLQMTQRGGTGSSREKPIKLCYVTPEKVRRCYTMSAKLSIHSQYVSRSDGQVQTIHECEPALRYSFWAALF